MPEILPVSAQFAERLRLHRTTRKYTAEKTANGITRCGYDVSRHSIAAIEAKNVRTVSIDMVMATVQFFGMSIGQFFQGPICPQCGDSPPPGFTCNTCHRSAAHLGQER